MHEDKFSWFDEAKFGLFIHWGLSSIFERDSSVIESKDGNIVYAGETFTGEEFAKRAELFKPEKFSADAWAQLALDAGMKYAVLTTRHHEGFCLFDSKVSDLTSAKTAAKRDIVGEFVAGMRKAGLKVGLYYSLLDWSVPAHWNGPEKDPKGWAAYIEYIHTQVRELCTNYGKIDVLWFDGAWPYDPPSWKSEELLSMIYYLQPGILINNRTAIAADFDTPENQITPTDRHWESCQVMHGSWYYDPTLPVMSTWEVLIRLIRCAMGGGNFLLDVGPKPDGTFPELCVERLKEVGQWLKKHGAGIYGSERIRYNLGKFHTRKDKTLFLYFRWDVHWPSWGKEFWLYDVPEPVESAYIPATGQEIEVKWENGKLCLKNLPEEMPDIMGTVALRLK